MKASITLTIVFFSAVVLGGSLYDEKEDIKKEVTSLYDAVLKLSDKVTQDIVDEKSKSEEASATEAINSGEENSKAAAEKFEKNIVETARSAIARGKPVSAIECIIKVATEGRNLIAETLKEHVAKVNAVKINRDKELEAEILHTDLIKKATSGLKDETLEKLKAELNINNMKALKNDAIKKTNNAQKQLKDIDTRILKPVLKERYKSLRYAIEAKYNELRDTLLKRLQKCIA